MSSQVQLHNLFPQAAREGEPVWSLLVESVTPCEGGLEVVLRGRGVTAEAVQAAQAAACRAYGTAGIHLSMTWEEEPEPERRFAQAVEDREPELTLSPAETAQAEEILRQTFSQKHPSAAPCLREAEITLEGGSDPSPPRGAVASHPAGAASPGYGGGGRGSPGPAYAPGFGRARRW